METMLQQNLRPGETLLWSAKPEEFKTMDAVYRAPIIKKFVAILLFVTALTGWYLYVVSGSQRHDVGVIELLACVSPFLCVLTDFLDAKKLRNQVIYGLTDQRVLTLNSNQLYSVDYKQINYWDVVTDAAGHASLIFGDRAAKAKDDTMREITIRGVQVNADTDMCESYAMYGVTQDVDKMKAILSEYVG